MPGKRNKISITIGKKLQALERIDKGEPIKNVAAELGFTTSTISNWKKNRKRIEAFCASIISKRNLVKRGSIKKAKYETLDNALYEWYSQAIRNGAPISGIILRKKALSLNDNMGNDLTFTASVAWLERWKARYGVRFNITGDPLEDPAPIDESDQESEEEDTEYLLRLDEEET